MISLEEIRDIECKKLTAQIRKVGSSQYVILVCHLYIDHLLDRYILASTKNDVGFTGKNGLSFNNKLRMLHAIDGIDPQLKDGLEKLNKIRNDLVHEFGHELPNSKIEELGRTLGKDYNDIATSTQGGYEEILIKVGVFICGQLGFYTFTAEGYESKV